MLGLLPLAWATFVGVSRFNDYHHSVSDIIFGVGIGVFCGACPFLVIKNKLFEKKNIANDDYFALNDM